MHATTFLLATLATAASAGNLRRQDRPAPPLTPGSTEVCGQYETSEFNGYRISTNGWGWANGQGTQCSGYTGAQSITNVRWYSRWSWSGGPGQLKSYAAVDPIEYKKQYLSQYESLETTWDWTYAGDDLAANVGYHLTFQADANTTGPETFQVQVWLAQYGDISPLSSNGYPYTPIATPKIGDCTWDLAFGYNGRTKVYTFLPSDPSVRYESFQTDLLKFTTYLHENYADAGFDPSKLFVKVLFGGSEVFTGKNALFSVSRYSLTVK
ncbi:Glycosyl hydrolase family 12 [Teratosphaeria destructans]|uniref:Glycosyl hydrolase family 12 n=1 Tax=Teratosphaeria destructans TaxID=418781 RepID=A0A9W7SWP0_9PEZI|nr:Glycosyl hydrolase family 12 [Teratosphaeria destructans]